MHNLSIFRQMRMALAVIICSITFIGCGRSQYPPELGKRLEYEGSSLFYTAAVTEADARKLGDYLVQAGFFQKGNPGTVQITKESDVYQFRMVVKEGTEKDTEFLEIAGLFAAEISRDVFAGQHVEIHLCDKGLKTLETVTFQLKE